MANENIKLNKCDNITLLEGDIQLLMPQLGVLFDRIILPLPKDSQLFLDSVL